MRGRAGPSSLRSRGIPWPSIPWLHKAASPCRRQAAIPRGACRGCRRALARPPKASRPSGRAGPSISLPRTTSIPRHVWEPRPLTSGVRLSSPRRPRGERQIWPLRSPKCERDSRNRESGVSRRHGLPRGLSGDPRRPLLGQGAPRSRRRPGTDASEPSRPPFRDLAATARDPCEGIQAPPSARPHAPGMIRRAQTPRSPCARHVLGWDGDGRRPRRHEDHRRPPIPTPQAGYKRRALPLAGRPRGCKGAWGVTLRDGRLWVAACLPAISPLRVREPRRAPRYHPRRYTPR